MREPTASGRGVFHSTLLMFSYHSRALSGSDVYAATSARGRSISVSVRTSTGLLATPHLHHSPASNVAPFPRAMVAAAHLDAVAAVRQVERAERVARVTRLA